MTMVMTMKEKNKGNDDDNNNSIDGHPSEQKRGGGRRRDNILISHHHCCPTGREWLLCTTGRRGDPKSSDESTRYSKDSVMGGAA